MPESFEEHVGVMFDLMALAYEADLTRVFTFMMNREASQLVFPDLGINEPWHHVSHHGNEPEKLALLVKINTWQIELFGKFLERLRTTPDGDGTLLDHSLMLWGSGMSDSNSHSPLDVPLLLVGQGRRRVHGQPSPRRAEGDAARQRDARPGAEVRRGDRSLRRQHRAIRAVIADDGRSARWSARSRAAARGCGAGGRCGRPARRTPLIDAVKAGDRDAVRAPDCAARPTSTRPSRTAPRRCTGPCAADDLETVGAPAASGRQRHRRRIATA